MSIPSQDFSYIGTGTLLIREYGSAAPFLPVGNCSALKFSPSESVKKLPDQTAPGGGVRNETSRLDGCDMSYDFTDFSAENFARGLRADVTTIAGGTATETVVAYKGGYTPLAKIASAITTVKTPDDVTTYDVDADFSLVDGHLYLPSASGITDPVAGAVNVKVAYTYAAQKRVEALVKSNMQYEALFVGLNEARSGKAVRVHAYKVRGGLISEMAMIGEDYGSGSVTGGLMSDTTRVGEGLSKYFTADFVD